MLLQSGKYPTNRYFKCFGASALQVHKDLRGVCLVSGKYPHQRRVLGGGDNQRRGRGGDLPRGLVFKGLELKIKTAGDPQTHNGRRNKGKNIGRGDGGQPACGLSYYSANLLFRKSAFIPWLQNHNSECHIFSCAAEQAEPADSQNVVNTVNILKCSGDFLHHLVGTGNRCPLRQLGVDKKGALVLRRQKAARRASEQKIAGTQHTDEYEQRYKQSPDQPCGAGHINVA